MLLVIKGTDTTNIISVDVSLRRSHGKTTKKKKQRRTYSHCVVFFIRSLYKFSGRSLARVLY